MENESKLRVIIVGSGVAGLTAARILREHHDVTVYERGDRAVATGGQGISISPSSVKILEPLGYDRDRAGAVPLLGFRSYDKDGNVKTDFEVDLKSKYGADQLAQTRSDFREELLRLATAPSTELKIRGDPAKMVFGTAVIDVDPEKGLITLSDGSIAEADVVVVADGVHSRLRNRVLDDDSIVAKKMGFTCYRVAISAEDCKKALGSLPHWWEPSTAKNRAVIIESGDGSDRFVVAYPLRHLQYMNLSCVFPSQESKGSTTDSWYADGDHNEMLEVFSDFYEPLRKILSTATEVKYWELQDLDPLPTWTRGRAILIGDAARAMTPLQGQGANQSVEDGESLRLLNGVQPKDVYGVLETIDGVRRPRAKQVQLDTREMAREITCEERLSKFDFLFSYTGIQDALKQKRI